MTYISEEELEKVLPQKTLRRFVVGAQDSGHWVEPSYSEEIRNIALDDCKKAISTHFCKPVDKTLEPLNEREVYDFIAGYTTLSPLAITRKICAKFGKPIAVEDIPKIDGVYQCEHVKESVLRGNCVWCNLTVAEKIIDRLKAENTELKGKPEVKEEIKITCNSGVYCQYRYQEGSLIGCKFKEYCGYQCPQIARNDKPRISVDELEEIIRDIGAPQGLPLSLSKELAIAIHKRMAEKRE